uniref:Uncharacterized protein n=1 Tax=Manihot esculenta TaxID=3983 RepID=A0A2C9VHK3_MANES
MYLCCRLEIQIVQVDLYASYPSPLIFWCLYILCFFSPYYACSLYHFSQVLS